MANGLIVVLDKLRFVRGSVCEGLFAASGLSSGNKFVRKCRVCFSDAALSHTIVICAKDALKNRCFGSPAVAGVKADMRSMP